MEGSAARELKLLPNFLREAAVGGEFFREEDRVFAHPFIGVAQTL